MYLATARLHRPPARAALSRRISANCRKAKWIPRTPCARWQGWQKGPKTGDGGLSDVQSYGLLKNLKSHGEMFTVLDDCIESMTKENEEEPLNEKRRNFLLSCKR